MTTTNPTRRRRVRPGIYQTSSRRYVVRFRDAGKVRDRTFDTLAEAAEFKRDRELDRRDRERRDEIRSLDMATAGFVAETLDRLAALEERVAALEAGR